MSKKFDEVVVNLFDLDDAKFQAGHYDLNELVLDSISIVSLIAAMDVYFNIQISVPELKACQCIQDIYKLTER